MIKNKIKELEAIFNKKTGVLYVGRQLNTIPGGLKENITLNLIPYDGDIFSEIGLWAIELKFVDPEVNINEIIESAKKWVSDHIFTNTYIKQTLNDSSADYYCLNSECTITNGVIHAYGHSKIHSLSDGTVYAYDETEVNSTSGGITFLHDKSSVFASYYSSVYSKSSGEVIVRDNSILYIRGRCPNSIKAFEDACVIFEDNSETFSIDCAGLLLWDNATCKDLKSKTIMHSPDCKWMLTPTYE